ncbi:GPP34 family phosphoprotein [Mycolicibacterium sp.]|uniref:GOLPH3/VPS74 family protein n=1 Tax=Mycolicibacterium sp. TaxID=2320850 RepID=UPI0028AE244D|nr:GPP34 family phosphoprotein [Mycolicibacterium sp.]
MARIAEDLMLLLLDNPQAQPQLDRSRLGRVLAGGLILDLAYDCRVRPAWAEDAVTPGHLIALEGPMPMDPAVRPALQLLQQRSLTPAAAVAKIGKQAEDDVLDQLLRTGQIHQIGLTEHKFRRNHYRWPVKNRTRLSVTRSELLGALFERRSATPVTAAVIGLLHAVGGFSAVLGLNDAGVEEAGLRAAEIGYGEWVDRSDTAQVNLELTAAAVLPALG